jgi:hypothetical protein
MANDFDDDFELVTDDADANAPEASLLLVNEEIAPAGYYVVFDRSSGTILSISHATSTDLTADRKELFLAESWELDSLFSNKLNIDKLHVKYNLITKTYVLIVRKTYDNLFEREFTLVDIEETNNSLVDIMFNVVNKNVYFKPNHKRLAYYLSNHTPEHVLELSNSDLIFYVFDEQDPTLLYDKYNVKLQELIAEDYVKCKADWLDLMRTKKFKILASNAGIDYSLTIDDNYVKDHLEYNEVNVEEYPELPAMRLVIMENLVYLQSMMKNPTNYKLSADIDLYLHKEGEPETLLRKYVINRNDLANNNKIILDTDVPTCRTQVVCNNSHINIETIYE